MLKRLVKRLARPLARRLLARVDARVAEVRKECEAMAREMGPLQENLASIVREFGPIVARVQTHGRLTGEHSRMLAEQSQAWGEFKDRLEAIDEYLPVLLNAISSQNAATREARRAELELREGVGELRETVAGLREAVARTEEVGPQLAERIAQVESRSEFIRREVLLEARYGGQVKGMGASSVTEPRIVSREKVAEFGDDIRLNLGCGHIPIDGFLNVDGRPTDGVDIVAEVGDLPFEPGTVAHIHSAHLLEHFPVEELRRRLLPHWFGLLRPGGTFTAVVPDAETMLDEYSAGRLSFEDLRLVTFGDQEYDGDFHFNMFSKASITEILEEAGFTDVDVVEAGRRNGACYEMEMAARRSKDDG